MAQAASQDAQRWQELPQATLPGDVERGRGSGERTLCHRV